MPKSPEAASVIKFIDFPISYYTGTPQISFPIASFEEYDNVSASVSLSYHASGNKVNDVAESVGLGWRLNAGGMITRQVYGIPDDASHCQGFLTTRLSKTYASVLNDYNTGNAGALLESALNTQDIEPDEFYFAFNGYTGKFAFDWTNSATAKPVLSTSSPIQISNFVQDPTTKRITSWELVDGMGVKYLFADIELTTVGSLTGARLEGTCNGPHAYASGWHLTKITSPNTAYFINFQYDDYGYSKNNQFLFETCTANAGGMASCPNFPITPGSNTCHEPSSGVITYSISGKRPKKIINSTGKFEIEFTATTNRTDNPGTATNFNQIDAVTLKHSGQLFSKMNFAYSYQGNRLMLQSLEEEGLNLQKLPKYLFTYNSGVLQSYDSKAIDYWGYQNGNTSNRLTPFFFGNFGGQTTLVPGADRNPQLAGTKSQILEKVTFPNGGYTEFEYEQNTCSYINGTTVESKPQYEEVTRLRQVAAVGSTSTWSIEESTPITLDGSRLVTATISGHTWAYYGGIGNAPKAYIKDGSGTIIYSWQLAVADFTTCLPPCYSTQTSYITLPTGTYSIGCKARKFADSPTSNGNDGVEFQISYTELLTAAPLLIQPVGGLRIKEIRSHDPLSVQTLTKKYQYTDEDNPNYSSGVIYADPINVYDRKFVFMPQSGCVWGDCLYKDIVGTSRFAVGATSGSHIGYRRVIEIIGNAQDGGKTVMNFTSPKEYPDAINTIKPFARPETQSYKTGLLTQKRLYDKNNALVAQEDVTYTFKEFSISVPKIGFGEYDRGLVSSSTVGCPSDPYEALPAWQKYTAWWGLLKMGFPQVASKTSRTYYGSNYTEIQTQNTYDINLQLLKSSTTKDLSIGYEWKQETTYPRDYACPSACTSTDPAMKAILEMITRNQVAYPIERTFWLKKTGFTSFQLTGAQLMEYDQFGDYTKIRPSKLHMLFTNTPISNFVPSSRNASNQLVKDSRYAQESGYGFDNTTSLLTEQYRVANNWDAKEQYIWSHERRLPIAKVVNANSNEVAFTSFEDAGVEAEKNGGWVISASGGWNSAAGYFVTGKNGYNIGTRTITRSGLPAGKYIVSFWYRDANILVNTATVTSAPSSTWQYVEYTATLSATGSIIVTGANGSSYIDELRLYPADAMMQTFSYDNARLLLLSTADESGMPVHGEYDNLHRLRASRNLDRNIRQTTQYTYSPSNAQNSVKTRTLLAPTTDFATASTTTSGMTSISYFDGLGRMAQSCQVGLSPTGKDIIMPAQYDIVGRTTRSYMPFTATTNGGAYRTTAFTDQTTFANTFGASGYGYSEIAFDLSPLNRVVAQGVPGASWQINSANKTTLAYRTNTAADNVRNFFGTANYPANALHVTEITDQNGKKVFSFTDNMGRLILSKQQIPATLTGNEDADYARTYNVYDDFGRDVAVIPPEAALKMKTSGNWDYTNATYANMIYRYQYDSRGRLISKSVPSAGITSVTYDRLDRSVLTTDANGFKIFTRYDILSRPVVTGRYKGTVVPANTDPLFETPNTSSASHFYSTTSFPTDNNLDVYKVFYYDDYDLDNSGGALGTSETYTNPAESPYATTALMTVRGKLTATKTGVLKNDGTAPTQFLMSRSYIDREYNPIQSNSQNHLNGSDIISTAYDFGNRVTDTRRNHTALLHPSNPVQSHTIRESYVYDAAGRLRFTRNKINNNNWVVTSAPVYDELDRVSDKRLHASNYDGTSAVTLSSTFNYLQSLDYTYNIQGRLTGINDPTSCSVQAGDNLNDMFSMSMTYENTLTGATAQYNGNISSIQWNTHINGVCGTRQLYRFSYDGADRLTSAAHRTWSGIAWTDPGRYNESGISYDLNGNLKSYTRQGLTSGTSTFGTIDQLTYFYEDAARPDRLTRVTDASNATKGFKFNSAATTPHYLYDASGNLTQDKHKNLTLTYNFLNLPQSFLVGSSSINITYTADGEKISKNTETSSSTIQYVAGIEYRGANLDAIYHAEGRCTPNGATAFHYEYSLRDHLGNARVNFRANGTAVTFLEESHYYPYGMVMEGIGTAATTTNNYKFNGKELNAELGINLYDYGARWLDPALARWSVVDPMAEVTASNSVYGYTLGNPIRYVDVFGMFSDEPCYDCPGKSESTASSGGVDPQMLSNFKSLQSNARYAQSAANDEMMKGSAPDDWFFNKYTGELRWYSGGNYNTGIGVAPDSWIWTGFKDIKPAASQRDHYFRNRPRYSREIPPIGKFISASDRSRIASQSLIATNSDKSYLYNFASDAPIWWTTAVGTIFGVGDVIDLGFAAYYGGIRVLGFGGATMAAKGGDVAELSSLNPTHYISKSESVMKRFVSGVKGDGAINESIFYVEHNGSKYIVDGHHRFFAAQKLGIRNVPVQQVQLPFRGYQTASDLILSGKQPGWWKFYKP